MSNWKKILGFRNMQEKLKKYAPNESLNVDILPLLYFEPSRNQTYISQEL
jgi:hypothetical protein